MISSKLKVTVEDIDIRQATLDDVIGIVYVQASFWIATYPSAENGISEADIRSIDFHTRVRDWQHMIQSASYQVWVAARGDKIIGVLAARKDGSQNEIYERCVLANAEPPDIAERLLAKALAWLDEGEMIKTRIISYDQTAVNLFQQFGFKVSELGEVDFIRLPSGKNIPTLEMRRNDETETRPAEQKQTQEAAKTVREVVNEPAPDVADKFSAIRLVGRAKLAKLSKLRPSTIKFYTEIGLLPFEQEEKRLARRYNVEQALSRLKQIQALRNQGLSIKEIAERLSTH